MAQAVFVNFVAGAACLEVDEASLGVIAYKIVCNHFFFYSLKFVASAVVPAKFSRTEGLP